MNNNELTGTNGTNKKQMGKEQLDYLKILEKNMGLITAACKNFGDMSRTTHYRWMDTYEGFRERVEEINEQNIDFAEGKLLSLINDGETAAILFYLKCKAKKRGYVEKQEVEHSGGVSIKVDWE